MTSSHNEEAVATDAAPAGKEHAVGVLLVHGIGQQPEGDTLLGFGEPLIRWLDRWLRRDTDHGATGSFDVLRARLTPSKSALDVPPHALAQLTLNQDGQPSTARWLLAESWWSGDVQPPPFGRFAGWLLTIGAWSAVAHTTKWTANIKEGWRRVLADTGATILGLLLAMLLQLAVLALAILAIPPIPPLRKRLSSILLAMTGVLGDCYVLVESDLQRGAIVTRTRAALRWLAERCERVVVIAHSQGAAVAHYALRDADPPNVELLVTLGSGLGKLSELEHAGRTMGRVRSMARVAPLVMLLLGMLGYVMLFEQRDGLSDLALYFMGFLAFVAIAWAVLTARQHWSTTAQRAGALSLQGLRRRFRWIDIHATRDPVPNGEMLPGGVRVPGLTPASVMNHASVIGDHTTYWENRCEFIPCVLRALSGALELGFFSTADKAALNAVGRRHRRAVKWLSVSRWATALGVVLLFWLYGDNLLVRGRDLAEALGGPATPFAAVIAQVRGIAMFVLRLAFGNSATDVAYRLLGAALPITMIAVWQYGYRFLWRWWDNLALEEVLKPGSIHRVDYAVLSGTVLLLGVVPFGVVLGWPSLRGIVVGHVIASGWIAVYGLLALLVGFQVIRRTVTLGSAIRGGDAAARRQLVEDLKTLGGFGLLLAFLLWLTVPAFEPLQDAGAALLGTGISIAALGYLQLWYVKRVQGTSWSTPVKALAVVGPPVIAVSLTVTLAVILGPQRGDSGLSAGQALLITFGLGYFLLLGLAALTVRFVRAR